MRQPLGVPVKVSRPIDLRHVPGPLAALGRPVSCALRIPQPSRGETGMRAIVLAAGLFLFAAPTLAAAAGDVAEGRQVFEEKCAK